MHCVVFTTWTIFLRYINFEQAGEPIQFDISIELTSIFNYFAFHAYQHNNAKFIEGLQFVRNNGVQMSRSMYSFVYAELGRFVLQLRMKDDFSLCVQKIEAFLYNPSESPLSFVSHCLLLSAFAMENQQYKRAIEYLEQGLQCIPSAKVQMRNVVLVEHQYALLFQDAGLVNESILESIDFEYVTYTEHESVMRALAARGVIWSKLERTNELVEDLDALRKLCHRFPLTQDVLDRLRGIQQREGQESIEHMQVNNALVPFDLQSVLPFEPQQ